MKTLLVAIPSYNRKDMLDKILTKYKNYNIDVLVFGQGYDSAFVSKHSKHSIFINYNKPMGIGYIRKNMFEYIFEKLNETYEFLIMHDDDLMLEKEDMIFLLRQLEHNQSVHVSTPDLYGLCNNLDKIISDVVFSVGCFRMSRLKDIYQHLTLGLNANEDAELMYLMGQKGLLLNSRFFKSLLNEKEIHSNSVISDRKTEFEKSAKILNDKYGKALNISLTEKSKNMITKFSVFRPTIIYFEGVDKTGKSSILKEFNKISNFEYYTSDRSPISTMVYSELFGRNINSEILMDYLRTNKINILIVYTHCSESKIKKRLIESNHESIDISENLRLFDNIINKLESENFNIIKINTNQTSAELNAMTLYHRILSGDISDGQ
jgi:hypothetical protein